VTELDLRHSLIPDDLVEELVKTMPAHSGTSTQEDRNLPKYDYVTFMERFMGGSSNGNQQQSSTFAPTRPRSSSPTKAAVNGYPPTNGSALTSRPTDRQYVDIF
jgi:hypothetical protein